MPMLKAFYKSLIFRRASRLKPWGRDEDEFSYSNWEFGLAEADWRKFYDGVVELKGKRVLDLGCGLGGRTVFYASKGPVEIVGIDIIEENVEKSILFAKLKGQGDTARFETADAVALPHDDASFDIAFSENSFEHYSNPEGILRETARVIKKGGLFVANFPQWGTPNGHHMDPWIDVSWAHLVFSTEEMVEIAREAGALLFKRVQDEAWRNKLAQKLELDIEHHRKYLNRISIRGFEKMVSDSTEWSVKFRRHTAAIWWTFPLRNIHGLREILAGRNFYLLERL
jgi:ubiquinone/menaquinone biosynthesis C-methylase UbiE